MFSNQKNEWRIVVELMHVYRDVMRITEHATGMSKSRLEILNELTRADEVTQADLAKHLTVEGAVVTRIVKQLEAEGLVTRRPDPRDNRYILVALTPRARDLDIIDEADDFKSLFITDLLDGLSQPERDELLRMLKLLQENAQAIRGAMK